MNVGWGTGQRVLIGYGATIDCAHCRNRVVEQVFATYSYEQAFFVRWKHLGDRGSQAGDGLILFLCPTCLHGTQTFGAEAVEPEKKRIAKQAGGAAAAAFAIEAQRRLAEAQIRFNISHTSKWFASLPIFTQRSMQKLFRRLGLFGLLAQLS